MTPGLWTPGLGTPTTLRLGTPTLGTPVGSPRLGEQVPKTCLNMLPAKPSWLHRLTNDPHLALSINQWLLGARLSKLSLRSTIPPQTFPSKLNSLPHTSSTLIILSWKFHQSTCITV